MDGFITIGNIVTIQEGAVFGGRGSSRGDLLPEDLLAPTTHTITRIREHHGQEEAYLGEIDAWVAVHHLDLAVAEMFITLQRPKTNK